MHLRPPLTPEDALEAGQAAGIHAVINIGNDSSDNREGIELAQRLPGQRTTIGWHPHVAGEAMSAEQRRTLRRQAAHPLVVAVGEIGLDYYFTDYHRVPPVVQARAFRSMLGLSQEVGKPIVLHTRDAFPDLLAILDEFPGLTGVFHCFSGDVTFAQEAVARGFYVSFAATVTYPNARAIHDAAAMVPLQRMLVETDSPFLPPQSRRGQPNAPQYLWETVERIAGLRRAARETIADATRRNAQRLFALGSS